MTTLRRLLVAVYPIRLFLLALAVWGVAADVRAQSPINVGYYDIAAGTGIPQQIPPIVAAGFTPVPLSSVAAADLADLQILFVHNPNGMGYSAAYLAAVPHIRAAVEAGLVLVIHDRSVGPSANMGTRLILPLPTGVPFPVFARVNSNNTSVSDAATLVASGPGGTVTEMTLDNGNFSNMGFAMLSTFTAPGKKGLLHTGTAHNNAVTFSYPLGLGFVIYSSVPLDMFLKGGGPHPPRCNFNNIYAPNVLAYAANLKELPQGLPQATTLNVTASPAQYGGTTTLTATLKSGAAGLGCRLVNFSLNGNEVGSALTDSSGTATLVNASIGSIGAGGYAEAVRADFAGAGPLTASSGTAALEVMKAPLNVTAEDTTKAYGAELPAFSAHYDGFVLAEAPNVLEGILTFATPATQSSPAGAYAITPYGLTSNNYDITFNDGTLTITPVQLTITADDKNQTYGGTPPAFTAVYEGFIAGDDVSVLGGQLAFVTPAQTSPVGSYEVMPYGVTSDRYTIRFVPGTLTVTPAPLTIRADDQTKIYGAALPAFTAAYEGFVLGETPGVLGGSLTFTTPANANSAVGQYELTPSGLTSSNYGITFASGTVTVTPAALKIRADDKERLVGVLNPPLTVTYDGFVLDETANNLDVQPTVSTPAVLTSPAGSYPIMAGGAADSNYTIEHIDGTLTLSPEGRMHGSGYVDTPGARHNFVFDARETIVLGEKGSLSLRVDRETEADDVFVSQLVTSVIFKNNPDVDPGGNAIADSVTFTGIGTWNGAAATFEVAAADIGEPGVGYDTVTIKIGVFGLVVHTTTGTINGGNIQSNRLPGR